MTEPQGVYMVSAEHLDSVHELAADPQIAAAASQSGHDDELVSGAGADAC